MPKFALSQSEALSSVQMCNLIWLQYHGRLAEFGYERYLIVPFSYALAAAYHACLVSVWVF